jgi:hypothetical protein
MWRGIEFRMNRKYSTRLVTLLAALLFVVPALSAKTSGVFRGILVENPHGQTPDGFVYLRARNGTMRKVETSKATVAYDESVPKEQQTGAAAEALKPGADVRITAEQEGDGEWHASRIDIMGSQASQQMFMDDDQDDDDGYQLQPVGSTRPVIRKGM